MTHPSRTQSPDFYIRVWRTLASWIAALTGSVSLAGWIFDSPRLTTLGFGFADPVKIGTGVGFVFLALVYFFWTQEWRGSRTGFLLRIVLSVSTLLLGIGSLAIRTLDSGETVEGIETSPFRMSVNTALSLASLGIAWMIGRFADETQEEQRAVHWISQLAALFAATIGYVAIIGHAYSASLLYGFSRDVNMSLPSAITVFALGMGAFFRFDRAALAREVLDASVGGRLIRRVVLTASIVIPLIGAVRLAAQDHALVDTRLGAALFAASNVLLLAGGIWIGGRRLNQVAASERFVRKALSDQASSLELRVRERTAELVSSEARFRLLADAAPVLILQADDALGVQSMNAMASAFLGQSDGILPEVWRESIHSDDAERLRLESKRSAELRTAFSLQLRLRRRDGEYRWMEVRGVPQLGNNESVIGYIVICLDVTDAYLARQDLTHALDSVEQALGRERILRREIDHRVRNNISSLLGLTAFYESSARADPNALAVTSALRGKIRAMKEVHDLVVRTSGGAINIHTLWERLLGAMVPDDLRSRITIKLGELPAAKPNQASALAMVLQELLANSAKHGALGAVEGDLRIEWSMHDSDCQLLWSERWSSLRDAGDDEQVSGLGLDLIRGLIGSDLRGSCDFQSTPDSWNAQLHMKLG